MIQANELRVGLCLLVCGEITQISSGFIADYDFSLRHNFSNNTPIARYSVCPIPLTPEILEKGGFRIDPNSKKHAGKVYRCQGVTINLETSRIKYLHQLQNLYFALTGEELQIEL